MTSFTAVLIGAPKVGKTTYLERIVTGNFVEEYKPTHSWETHHLLFNTNKGEVLLNIVDNGGDQMLPAEKVNACIAT